MTTKQKTFFKSLLLPLLGMAYPILFLFGQNVSKLGSSSLFLPLGLSLWVALTVFGVCYLLQRKAITASLSALLFVPVYYVYGHIYRLLVQRDWFPVQHYLLLPVVAALALYLINFLRFIKPSPAKIIQKVLLIVAAAMVGFNLIVIAFASAQSAIANQSAATPVQASSASVSRDPTAHYPDIYYIIFDEYAGFDAIREYWHENYVDEFDQYLKDNGFFVAEDSRSVTINTGTEIASRLNFHQYTDLKDTKTTQKAIDNNKVMQIVKSYGYSTVVMDMAFANIASDDSTAYNADEVGGMAADEFKQTFFDDTMLLPFSNDLNGANQTALKQRAMIEYSLAHTADLPKTKNPKFVFTHVLIPHEPFIFDENGDMIDPQHATDWHYYLGQHKYATKLAQDLMAKLLKNADPANPPVIILQSDHGARDLARKTKDNVILDGYLENYDMKYSHYILNALYVPGYDTSEFPQDLSPLNAVAMVLNHYLHAGVVVDTNAAQK
jgi:hypothetical protein